MFHNSPQATRSQTGMTAGHRMEQRTHEKVSLMATHFSYIFNYLSLLRKLIQQCWLFWSHTLYCCTTGIYYSEWLVGLHLLGDLVITIFNPFTEYIIPPAKPLGQCCWLFKFVYKQDKQLSENQKTRLKHFWEMPNKNLGVLDFRTFLNKGLNGTAVSNVCCCPSTTHFLQNNNFNNTRIFKSKLLKCQELL